MYSNFSNSMLFFRQILQSLASLFFDLKITENVSLGSLIIVVTIAFVVFNAFLSIISSYGRKEMRAMKSEKEKFSNEKNKSVKK